jgi:hypothetical protein
MRTPPFIIGGLAMGWGWLSAALSRAPRYEDREFREFLRAFQHACLLMGKRRATERFEVQRAAAWDPGRPSPPLPDEGGARPGGGA